MFAFKVRIYLRNLISVVFDLMQNIEINLCVLMDDLLCIYTFWWIDFGELITSPSSDSDMWNEGSYLYSNYGGLFSYWYFLLYSVITICIFIHFKSLFLSPSSKLFCQLKMRSIQWWILAIICISSMSLSYNSTERSIINK